MTVSDRPPLPAGPSRRVFRLSAVVAVVLLLGMLALGVGMIVHNFRAGGDGRAPAAIPEDPALAGLALVLVALWNLAYLARRRHPPPAPAVEPTTGPPLFWIYKVGAISVVLVAILPLARGFWEISTGKGGAEAISDIFWGIAFCAVGLAMLAGIRLASQRGAMKLDRRSRGVAGEARIPDEARSWRAAGLGFCFLILLLSGPCAADYLLPDAGDETDYPLGRPENRDRRPDEEDHHGSHDSLRVRVAEGRSGIDGSASPFHPLEASAPRETAMDRSQS
jgi:hypothetical protein